MKIFLDTADTEVIKEHFETGLIDGITTNPTLIRKSGRDPEDVYQELVDLGIQDISMEVVGDAQTMLNEGLRLSEKFGSVATIKLPCDRNGLRVCHELTKEKIRTNVTLIFSTSQAILAAKAGATYVSPFVGRLNDNSFSGVELVRAIAGTYSVQGVLYTGLSGVSEGLSSRITVPPVWCQHCDSSSRSIPEDVWSCSDP